MEEKIEIEKAGEKYELILSEFEIQVCKNGVKETRVNHACRQEIHFSSNIDVIIKGVKKKCKGFSVSDEVVQKCMIHLAQVEKNITARQEREIIENKTRAAKYVITGFTYINGCDRSDEHRFMYGPSEEFKKESYSFKELVRMRDYGMVDKIARLDLIKLGKELNAEYLPADGGSYLGYNFNKEQTQTLCKLAEELAQKMQAEKEQKQKQKKEELQAKQNAALQKAKETGKNVFVRVVGSYDADAEDDGESERGVVTISEYATPDGRLVESESAGY